MGVTLSNKDLLLLFEGKTPQRRQEIRDAMGGCPFDPMQCPDDYCDEHWSDGEEEDPDLVVTATVRAGKKGARGHAHEEPRNPIREVQHTLGLMLRSVLALSFGLVVLMALTKG